MVAGVMTVLVTGGAGMLGRAIVEQLVERGEQVRVLDLQAPMRDDVEWIQGNITDAADVSQACDGVDAVIHTASLVNLELGEPQIVYDVNVTGTEHIIEACVQHGVEKLIYTSSIDVVFDGTPIVEGDETLPYPQHHLDYYGTTKAAAEKAVIAANGSGTLATAAIRSAGIYGPYDKHRFPNVIGNVLNGQFIRIGDGRAQFSHVYVENMAHAHLLLMDHLTLGAPAAGSVYFITDGPPSNFFDFFMPYLDALDLDYEVQSIPKPVAHLMARFLEWRYRLFPGEHTKHAQITRYAVASVTEDFWFAHDKATDDFGYEPIVSQEEAFDRTLDWLRRVWLPQQHQS